MMPWCMSQPCPLPPPVFFSALHAVVYLGLVAGYGSIGSFSWWRFEGTMLFECTTPWCLVRQYRFSRSK